jgi:sec-independent protein translocase protein TatB
MIDFGFDKIALIGAVALIVIGPEKLPRVARTVGHFIGKAQRYVSDVKAEVNRSIELDELKKMKSTFEDAARNVEQSVSNEIHQTTSDLNNLGNSWAGTDLTNTPMPDHSGQHDNLRPPPEYKHPNKRWRLKQAAVPQWFKQRSGVRGKVQSGAARVARFRPRKTST